MGLGLGLSTHGVEGALQTLDRVATRLEGQDYRCGYGWGWNLGLGLGLRSRLGLGLRGPTHGVEGALQTLDRVAARLEGQATGLVERDLLVALVEALLGLGG